jgi:hypothetical protein
VQATKLKGIINQQGKLIVEEPINLHPGEVEVVILQTDDLANQKKEIKPRGNQEEKKSNESSQQITKDLSEREYTLEQLLNDEMEISEEINWGEPQGEEIW